MLTRILNLPYITQVNKVPFSPFPESQDPVNLSEMSIHLIFLIKKLDHLSDAEFHN